MRFSRAILASAVIALVVSGGASLAGATPLGSIGYVALGGASADTTDLATATTVSIAPGFVTSGDGQGDLGPIVSGTAISITPTVFAVTPLNVPEVSSLVLDVSGNIFSFTEQEVTVHSSTGSGPSEHSTLTLAFTGSVTGPDITGGSDSASATFTFNQTGGSGATISFAGTAAHPSQISVPEPAGFAALGVGLLGLGLIRRRHG